MAADNILAMLVAADKKACAMVDDAQEVLDSTSTGLEREIARFREEYAQRASRQIGLAREKEDKASQTALEDIAQRRDKLMAGLEQAYQEHHQEWEADIFRRCVEG